MTPRYELSNAAADDLDAILTSSLERFGAETTRHYVDSLESCLSLLAANPDLGLPVQGLRTVYRRFPHERHTVYYRSTDAGILIIRILHQRMDPSGGFEPAPDQG